MPTMTKICVVGGGPAGMYTTKFLLKNNFKVTLYEKDSLFSSFKKVISPFTNYTFNHFDNTVLHTNLKCKFGKKVNINDIEHKYDAFILATGALKPKRLDSDKNKLCVQAIDIAKNYNNNKIKIGNNVLIIGCGNVAMDIAKYLILKKKVENITIFARKGPFDVPSTNAEIRNIHEIDNTKVKSNINIEDEFLKLQKRRRDENIITKNNNNALNERRMKIFQKLTSGNKTVDFKFYTDTDKIICEGNKIKVYYNEKGQEKNSIFDTVISAIGFEKPKHVHNIKKPVFYVGWCKNPIGSLIDIKMDAISVVKQIKNYFKKD